MLVQSDISLADLTTMRLGGLAHHVVTISNNDDLLEALHFSRDQNLPHFVLGSGSNVIAGDTGFAGVIILNRITGFEVIADDDTSTTIKIGAGENWDTTVARLVDMNLSGVEAMSSIPGTVGATPVQNVGAYGQEIADILVECEAYDTDSDEFVTLSKKDCHFSYRNSIFKNPSSRHHVITSITLRLNKTPLAPPFYNSLQKYLDDKKIDDFSPGSIRQAVTAIRSIKLPDPSVVANTGSFFKNPIVSKEVSDHLSKQFHSMPTFPTSDGSVKLAAGWLIEQSGLKGHSAYGCMTYENNALVVVNQSARSTADLWLFRDEIVARVKSRFGVVLQQEPETL